MTSLAKLIGYMTEKEAIENGMTHHGYYYGIPLWIAPDKDFLTATKWAPLEIMMTVFHIAEGALQSIFFPDRERGFMFLLGPKIGEKRMTKPMRDTLIDIAGAIAVLCLVCVCVIVRM